MRKICVMATVIATMVFMTACGGNKEEATTAVTTTQETTTDVRGQHGTQEKRPLERREPPCPSRRMSGRH